MTKMTNEALKHALDVLEDGAPSEIRARHAEMVRAHIAALTAERDAATTTLEEKSASYDSLALSFTQANEETRHQRYRAETAERARDTLRERVLALEAENIELQREANRQASRLAAHRLRVQSRLGLGGVIARYTGRPGPELLAALERYILGDDATGAPVSELDGLEGEMVEATPATPAALAPVSPLLSIESYEALVEEMTERTENAASVTAKAFAGELIFVLGEATDGDPHAHTCRLSLYAFPDGSRVPYLDVSESEGPHTGRRTLALSTAVHALLNLGEAELFEVGNRIPESKCPHGKVGPEHCATCSLTAVSSVDSWKQEASATLETCATELGVRGVTAEPTTAEAFATVRMTDERLRNLCEQEPGLDADDADEVLAELKRARDNEALLERHMGAMERALRDVIDTKAKHTVASINAWRFAREVLTTADAPPVFTLEEVRVGLAPWASHGLLVDRVLERLTARRK